MATLAVTVASITLIAAGTTGRTSGPTVPGDAATVPSGHYVLDNSNRGISLSFPSCSHVTAEWRVVRGSEANFSVWPPDAVLANQCAEPPGPAPCPSWACGWASTGPGPVCFESGRGGGCWFNATQTAYDFVLATPYSSVGGSTPLGNVVVDFTVNCTS